MAESYETSPEEGWPLWMDRHISAADFVLMVCTETYFRRVKGEEKKSLAAASACGGKATLSISTFTTPKNKARNSFPCCSLTATRRTFRRLSKERVTTSSILKTVTKTSTATSPDNPRSH